MSNHPLLVTSAANGVKLWSYTPPSSNQAKSTSDNPCRLVYVLGKDEAGGNVNTTCWSEDGKLLGLTGSDGIISIHNPDGSRVDSITADGLRGGFGEISTMCMAQRGRQVMVAGSHGIIRRWDRQDGRWLESLTGHKGAITSMALDIDQTHLGSVSVMGKLIVHNLQKGLQQPYSIPTEQSLNAIDYSKFRKSLLLCGGDDGAVHMLDTNQGQTPIQTFQSVHSAPVKGVAFSPFNRYLMCSAGLDKRVVLYDAEKQGAIKTLSTDQPLTTLSFKNDGVTIAAGTIQGKLLLFDLRSSSKPLASVWAHEPHAVKSTLFQLQPLGKKSSNTGSSKRTSTVLNATESVTPTLTDTKTEMISHRGTRRLPSPPPPTTTTTTTLDDPMDLVSPPMRRSQTASSVNTHITSNNNNNNNNNITYMDMFSPVKDQEKDQENNGPVEFESAFTGDSARMMRRVTSPSGTRPVREGSGRLEREILRSKSRSDRESYAYSATGTTTSSQSGLSRENSGGYNGATAIPEREGTGDGSGGGYSGSGSGSGGIRRPSVSPRNSYYTSRPSSVLGEERAGSPLARHSRTRSQVTFGKSDSGGRSGGSIDIDANSEGDGIAPPSNGSTREIRNLKTRSNVYELGGRDITPPTTYHRRHRSSISYTTNDGSVGAAVNAAIRPRLPQLNIVAKGTAMENGSDSMLKSAPAISRVQHGFTGLYDDTPLSAMPALASSTMNGHDTPQTNELSNTNSFQLRIVERVVEDCMQDFREEIRADLQNLHLELLRQFHIQRVSSLYCN
ncbi:WD40-repeat-containing domain protein [Syncephalis fuscata]|nr:WD40-repeat-containing domain protein [Syncephalis fuscata]